MFHLAPASVLRVVPGSPPTLQVPARGKSCDKPAGQAPSVQQPRGEARGRAAGPPSGGSARRRSPAASGPLAREESLHVQTIVSCTFRRSRARGCPRCVVVGARHRQRVLNMHRQRRRADVNARAARQLRGRVRGTYVTRAHEIWGTKAPGAVPRFSRWRPVAPLHPS
eukprot:gene6618-biopygen2918